MFDLTHSKGFACIGFFTMLVSQSAWGIELDLPIQCDLGKSCFIQNYFDHQQGLDYKDYRCGHLSYNEHLGTDFRVIDEADMEKGVPVIAAAGGKVIGIRDGEPDIAISIRGKAHIIGKEAGNGVVIDHGDGWHTQYSHLRNGSVKVRLGEQVERGQQLGLVGESGNAEFPHVDFSVRKNGSAVDPFSPLKSWSCSRESSSLSLWTKQASQSLRYIDTAILQIGFSDHTPTRLEAQTGRFTGSDGNLHSEIRQLILWATVIGINAGDQWRIEVRFPNQQPMFSSKGRFSGNKAIATIGSGQRLSNDQWPRGRYRGIFVIERDGLLIQSRESMITID